MCLCEGARQEARRRGSCSPLQRHRQKQETNGGGSRGQCQGARHQARMAGRAASGGGGGAGKGTRGQQDGGTALSMYPYFHLEPTVPTHPPPAFVVLSLQTYMIFPLRPIEALTPTQSWRRFFFFFLKGPGRVGWLVDDEVSACTHRGFCLPLRVKPRLSERAPPPPPTALDPLSHNGLPQSILRTGMEGTWPRQSPSRPRTVPFLPLRPSHPQFTPSPPAGPPPAVTLGRGWQWADLVPRGGWAAWGGGAAVVISQTPG